MSWNTLKGINPSSPTYKKFIKFLDKLPKDELKQLANAKIKFVSILAKNRIKGESVNEGGMGILDKDQTDVLHGIVMKNKNKNTKAILSLAIKSGDFKGVDKKELLGYIDGAREFVKYMSMGRTGKELSVNEAKFTDDTLASRIKHWGKQHKGTGIGYGHVLGQLAVHMKDLGWNKSYKEVARIAVELGKKRKVESVNEAGMGILTSDQADVLQAIVMRNKNKNLKAILKIVMKDSMFKSVDKKELLGYIDGARQFVKYMKI